MSFVINNTARIVRDIEIMYTAEGTAIAKTAVVRSDKFKNKAGTLMEDACFIDIVGFGKTAEFMNQYFNKGDLIEFEGHLKQDKWEDKDGAKRSKHSITIDRAKFSQCKKSETGGGAPKEPSERGTPVTYGASTQAEQPAQAEQISQPQIPEIDINEDEIPF